MKTLINLGLTISLLTACGAEIAFKRGATGRDFAYEKAACQKATNEQALNQCLEEHGWAIQKLDGSTFSDDELFATASVTEGNRAITQKAPPPKIQTTENFQEDIASEKTIQTDGKKETIVVQMEDAKPKATPRATKPQPNIFDTYVIKSWWKMGGNAKLLDQNMEECQSQLGEAHMPNKKTFTFTRGFAICMRQKGWRGLIEK